MNFEPREFWKRPRKGENVRREGNPTCGMWNDMMFSNLFHNFLLFKVGLRQTTNPLTATWRRRLPRNVYLFVLFFKNKYDVYELK